MILERFKVPQKDQVLVSEAALRRTVAQIFEKLGVSADDAADAADVLTMTDLRGVETRGVSTMRRAYVRDYRAGKLDPRPGWRIVRQSPAAAVIDGERRLGIIVGSKAMRLAVEKARAVGVGVVTVYNAGHFGATGHFAMQAAEQDIVGVCFPGARGGVAGGAAAPAPDEPAPRERIEESFRRVQHRGVRRRRAVQGHDGPHAGDAADGTAGAGPRARSLSRALGVRRDAEAPGHGHPAAQGSAAVVRRVHARAGRPTPAYAGRTGLGWFWPESASKLDTFVDTSPPS